jgi:hypothetical protein
MSDTSESEQQGGSIPGEIIFAREKFVKKILGGERHRAEKLGTCECLAKWETTESFAVARQEWTDAWIRFARNNRFGSLFAFDAEETLEGRKDFALTMLRRANVPSVTLQNQAAVIHAAACEGDVSFFHAIAFALRSRTRQVEADFERSFLGFNVLMYWFAGLLWLMPEKPGWAALCAYTGRKDITKDAYRMECYRLGLKGHKDRMRSPSVLGFDPVTGTYNLQSVGVNKPRSTFVHLKK